MFTKGKFMNFDQFNIDPRCLAVLQRQGIQQPTPVQKEAIPVALEGRDVLAIAQTGTGKTLGFSLPSLTRLAAETPQRNSMLVVTPTRELAHQVNDVLNPLGQALGLKTLCIYGGVDMRKQTRALKEGAHIIVATPGRLLDHIRSRTIRFDHLSILVLDEADQMLDMGFLPDIKRIIPALPEQRQTLMFSATFPPNIAKLATDMQTNPKRIEVGRVATPTESVRQGVYTVAQQKKLDLLSNILSQPNVETALVFIRTKRRTDKVAKALHKAGFRAEAIHGDRSQSQRKRALDGFKSGRFNVLVATDVAARGIDVRGITHVVNFDLPGTSEDYVHRIGRTARASAEGDAITFVTPDEHRDLSSIERAIGKKMTRETWDGTVPERPAVEYRPEIEPERSRSRR
ncbi:MAG: DEAD/DEAH box helicase, partial [Candidatus Omnitrophica bacterium]|nr:DEAD/DEAH box helicase [Candidatus Omnitrophota bacterium]